MPKDRKVKSKYTEFLGKFWLQLNKRSVFTTNSNFKSLRIEKLIKLILKDIIYNND
jgi:hypothetical protein